MPKAASSRRRKRPLTCDNGANSSRDDRIWTCDPLTPRRINSPTAGSADAADSTYSHTSYRCRSRQMRHTPLLLMSTVDVRPGDACRRNPTACATEARHVGPPNTLAMIGKAGGVSI